LIRINAYNKERPMNEYIGLDVHQATISVILAASW
jgi:hypothetical protein